MRYLILILVLNAFGTFAQSGLEKANSYADETVKSISNREDIVGASITVGINDSIAFSKGYGFADKDLGIKTQVFHKFRIYSLSKHITGVAIAKLVEDGKLDIDKPINEYIPFLDEKLTGITSAQLLTHTSGIRSYYEGEWQKVSNGICSNPFEAILAFQSDDLLFEPGTDYSYTSFGYVLLSAVIEKVSGKSFMEYLNEELFFPLNLNTISLDNADRVDHLAAKPYEYWKEVMYNARYANNTCKFGGGGLSASSIDVVTFNLALLNKQVLSKNSLGNFFTTFNLNSGEPTNYGYGLQFDKDIDGISYAWHSGRSRGGRNALVIYPDYKIVVCISVNTNGDSIVEEAENIARSYLVAIKNP